jgi:hypothetical protein
VRDGPYILKVFSAVDMDANGGLDMEDFRAYFDSVACVCSLSSTWLRTEMSETYTDCTNADKEFAWWATSKGRQQ